jgi:hypothetical protein
MTIPSFDDLKPGLTADRVIAYTIGFGDPISRAVYEADPESVVWLPRAYTTNRNHAIELLPNGQEWDACAAALDAPAICKLAVQAKAAGLVRGSFPSRQVVSGTAAGRLKVRNRQRRFMLPRLVCRFRGTGCARLELRWLETETALNCNPVPPNRL